MKMPTIVGIFIFISREEFVFNWVEQEKYGKLFYCLLSKIDIY